MKSVENKLDSQVEIWAFAGPSLALITFFVLLVKSSLIPLTIPIVALVGISVCWKWKIPGLFGALTTLFLVVLYQDQFMPANERLWNLGLAISVGLAFVVTALSFEEVASCIKVIQLESSSRLNSLLQMDDKLQDIRQTLEVEKEKLLSQILNLETSLQEKNGQLVSQQKLNHVIQHELVHNHSHRERLEQELFVLRTQQASEMMKAASLVVEPFLSVRDNTFNEEFESLKLENAELHKKLHNSVEEIGLAHKHVKMLSKDLSAERELKEENRKFIERAQQEQILHQTIQQEINEHLETANREKQLLESSLVRLQQSLEMQRLQEQDKDELANSYLSTIHGLQAVSNQSEDLIKLEREKIAHLQTQYQLQEESYLEQLAIIEGKWLHAIQELSVLQVSNTNHELEEKVKDMESLLLQERRIIEHSNKEIRRINGVYQQLREQFEEKTRVLDETRRELFLAQEDLSLAQLKAKEDEWERHEEIREVGNHLSLMEKEIEDVAGAQAQEVEALGELVAVLSKVATNNEHVNDVASVSKITVPKKVKKKATVDK